MWDDCSLGRFSVGLGSASLNQYFGDQSMCRGAAGNGRPLD